ncbi:MAG TPA: DUF2971 domain-containing protein [Acidiferrobacterales bacterium]|nr:DUF2971 domain-containing protein [Acidiferrobacterales bacterium]
MDDNNYIDISPTLRAGFVYRIISVDQLFELFEKKQNVLVKPKKWEDPFENFILRSKVKLSTGDVATLGVRDQFFGQCWTLHSASDAMWRIYSPNANAVRIRSTVRKLADSLIHACGALSYVEAFIGKVKYLPNKRLIEYANNAFNGATIPYSKMFAQTLLVKRPAFKHEREVRLLLCLQDESLIENDLYAYAVDAHTLIDQIMIDPRLPEKDANLLRDKIIAKTTFKGPVKRSLLYAAPPKLVIPF